MLKSRDRRLAKTLPRKIRAKMPPTQLVNAQRSKTSFHQQNRSGLSRSNGQGCRVWPYHPARLEAAKTRHPCGGNAAFRRRAFRRAGRTLETHTKTNGVASPSQASVAIRPMTPAPVRYASQARQTPLLQQSAPADPSAELKIYDTSSQPLDQVLAQVQQRRRQYRGCRAAAENNVEALMKKQHAVFNVLAPSTSRKRYVAS